TERIQSALAQKTIAGMIGDTVSLLQMGCIVPGYNTVLAHYEEDLLWVNSEVNRFFDGPAWIIFDPNHEGVKYHDFPAELGLAWRADTIEEPADEAGLPRILLQQPSRNPAVTPPRRRHRIPCAFRKHGPVIGGLSMQ
ncbi:MAG: hypothetical protein ACI4WR_11010, partial [Bulleidia sp.]